QTADSTVGWYQSNEERAKGNEPSSSGDRLSPANSSYALSSDTNIVHVRATVRYTITDPLRFHFDFVDASVFITNALNSALLKATSEFKIDDILRQRKAAFHERVGVRLHEILDPQQLGVAVEQPEVQEYQPIFLKDKFDEVLRAGVARDSKVRN